MSGQVMSRSSQAATPPTQNSQTSLANLTVEELKKLFSIPIKANDEVQVKAREDAVLAVGKKLSGEKNTEELKNLILSTRPFLAVLGKAKAGKLVRTLVDYSLVIDEDAQIKVDLCKECVEWAKEQKRVYLRQTLEARLVRLYNDIGRYTDANSLALTLIKELKKIDDKDVLVEVQIEESKSLFCLGNLSRAKSALVGAKTTANAMYMNPKTQSELDLQSGILHAAEDHDFKTAFSYFYEAFENADQAEDKVMGTKALKYMCLSKIMLNEPEAIDKILTGKQAIKYFGSELEAMREVGKAFYSRVLKTFLAAFETYKKELMEDRVVKSHFSTLSESMIERELCRLIEPYKVVELKFIADKIGLPQVRVEKKLALMLLDKVFYGCLDQSYGVIYVHEHPGKEEGYKNAVDIIHVLSDTVNATYLMAHKLRLMETRVKASDVEKPVEKKRKKAGKKVKRTSSASSQTGSTSSAPRTE
ncbi:unnamed protein product [Bursaphelenchus xylophilus]|uniref:(pine wood nematode) hypothetical protein n=1 Tax=Bursaphelenchus xylophilus TaxID=6326 RepID=A0A1I7S420_BURXY|nr:unnamed protein product [Bursaphelenchus xylophilus]CAG9116634.1 unnamed protein product [Bursaphelenchus xylophilus]